MAVGTPCQDDDVIRCPDCGKECPVKELKEKENKRPYGSNEDMQRRKLEPSSFRCPRCGNKEQCMVYHVGDGNKFIPPLSKAVIIAKAPAEPELPPILEP